MSIGAKLRARDARRATKKAQKDAMRALAGNTINKAERRGNNRRSRGHQTEFCGNTGCRRCYPVTEESFRHYLDADGFPRNMPPWLFERWLRETYPYDGRESTRRGALAKVWAAVSEKRDVTVVVIERREAQSFLSPEVAPW